jgi:putative addiction module CopG family antidote
LGAEERAMPVKSMTIAFFEEDLAFVEALVASGRYLTPGEVVRDALHLLKNDEVVRDFRRAELEALLQAAADDDGDTRPAEEVFRELHERIDRIAASKNAAE